MRPILLAILVVVFLPVPASAQDLQALRKSVVTEVIEVHSPSRQQRVRFAVWIGQECQALLDKTPSLSPREEDWVNDELAQGRVMEVYQTPEFSKRFIRNTAAACINSADWIRASTSEAKEMAYWATLVAALLEDDWEWHVNNARRKGGVAGLTDDDAKNAGVMFNLAGKRFFQNIITAYLLRAL